jgi:heterodisulfide reductase subunit C/nitrate reductase gamma subunit
MIKQIIFIITLLITLGIFAYTVNRLIRLFNFTRGGFPIKNLGKRFRIMMNVAIGQTKIFRFPVIGFLHALVFWGFCVILIGSIEMVVDGIAGTERVFDALGVVYDVIIGAGDIFALIIAVAIIVFLARRFFLHVKRFQGIEMSHWSHLDANIALTLILVLMISLLGMNTFYLQHAIKTGSEIRGVFPVSQYFATMFSDMSVHQLHVYHEINWWVHILLIFFFANYLPYSKHFHVFMSVPNVFLSRLDPLGKLDTMENVKKEVKMMMDPNASFDESGEEEEVTRFGVKDVEDVMWKNYFDSLSCTQCGRCTSVCPANITGKTLSPRKIIMDVRDRMKEKGPKMLKEGKEYSDNKALLRDYISEEELWACTTCNACAQECPININQPTLIVEMRRYLVMEEASGPGEINAIFSNIENNGAPWQYAQEDRMQWAEELYINE